jgi:DNA-binding transcriptional regulator YdaS (Cro superfamily)
MVKRHSSLKVQFCVLSFQDLQYRLIVFVVTKIRNGEFTERRLARVLGVSQPQLHNVLKGARPLKPGFADCLMRQFEIGILDLVGCAEMAEYLEIHTDWPESRWLEKLGCGDSG